MLILISTPHPSRMLRPAICPTATSSLLEAVLNILAQSFHKIQVVLVGVMTSISTVNAA
jgi:hypothetical protein